MSVRVARIARINSLACTFASFSSLAKLPDDKSSGTAWQCEQRTPLEMQNPFITLINCFLLMSFGSTIRLVYVSGIIGPCAATGAAAAAAGA